MNRLALLLLLAATPVLAGGIDVSPRHAADIGRRIWQNESGGSVDGLTAWNSGEDFPSLGIGHFIWYPQGKEGPFDESFPKLIHFLQREGASVPGWLAKTPDSPWQTKAEFDREFKSPRTNELRQFLASTVPGQTRFIIDRLEAALPKMLDAAPRNRRDTIRDRFYAVASTPQGIYALIDYVNFKGEGVLSSERYKGEGWGLLQVLESMDGAPGGRDAAREFARSAKSVLTRRVKNSPPARNESRWLTGWKNRIDTYAE